MTETDKPALLRHLNDLSRQTMLEWMGIEFIDVGEDFLLAKMPVRPQVHQPYGLLHGGASVALGESVGSTLSNHVLTDSGLMAVGTDITAHHLRPVFTGTVYCRAVLRRKGTSVHYTEMEVTDEKGRLVCAMSMSNMVVARKQAT